jgi:unsaturated rhamnogalacturonyl hydrolase
MKPSHLRTAVLAALAVMLHAVPVHAAAADTPAAAQAAPSAAINPQAVLGAMERVADWQLANPSKHRPDDWTQAVGYNGIMALAGISGDRKYRDAMVEMGEKNGWKLGPRTYHADDQAVGQTYAELYLQLRQPEMLAPLRASSTTSSPSARAARCSSRKGNQDRWSWCDALFMGPPAWLRLYAGHRRPALPRARGQRNGGVTSDYLYDKAEHLYYRDSNYFNQREANGAKVFWATRQRLGDGRPGAHPAIPAGQPPVARPRFEQQFKEMAAKVVTLQQKDGLWRASLLDPASYPMQEPAAPALFAYALAWGVNQGLLDAQGLRAGRVAAWARWSPRSSRTAS